MAAIPLAETVIAPSRADASETIGNMNDR